MFLVFFYASGHLSYVNVDVAVSDAKPQDNFEGGQGPPLH